MINSIPSRNVSLSIRAMTFVFSWNAELDTKKHSFVERAVLFPSDKLVQVVYCGKPKQFPNERLLQSCELPAVIVVRLHPRTITSFSGWSPSWIQLETAGNPLFLKVVTLFCPFSEAPRPRMVRSVYRHNRFPENMQINVDGKPENKLSCSHTPLRARWAQVVSLAQRIDYSCTLNTNLASF